MGEVNDLPLGPFSYIRVKNPDSLKANVMESLREGFYEIWCEVTSVVPAGRYQALAKTAIEEASLWAQRGLALEYTDDEESVE